jgi:deoxyribodipyrimidine photo-lyase
VVDLTLFTRDLRVHDQPALAAAAAAGEMVVPLFVVDDGIRRGGFVHPNRARFLAESLGDLDDALRRRGGGLVVRAPGQGVTLRAPAISEPLPR